MTRVKEVGQLLELIVLQELDVHHVDKGPHIFELLVGFIELPAERLQLLVPESLIDSVHQRFESKRETWLHFLELLNVDQFG